MFSVLCNQLCIRIRQYTYRNVGIVAGWLAKRAGLKVVEADAVLLPKGCRPIPKHYYDVDPAVLNQLKDGNRAILHQVMKNWQVSNEQTGKHWFMNGDRWGTKSDPKTWHQQVFPFLTLRTVKAMIADLADASLLVIDGAWCQPLKAVFAGAEQMALPLGKDFQQPGKVFYSSIDSKSNSSKNKTGKQTSNIPRKAAVAEFSLPETRNKADFETHESPDFEVEGRDVLHELPGELVTQWTDDKLPLEQLVAIHGVERVNAKWQEARSFKNQVAGLRTLLKKSPGFAPPPSPAADVPTEPDWTEDDIPGNDTPAIDIDDLILKPMSAAEKERAWIEAHVAPALLANGGVQW